MAKRPTAIGLAALAPKMDDARLPRRFWSRVSPEPMSGCWLWTGCDSSGYGVISVDGRQQGAHRVSYETLIGPVSSHLVIDHLCRVRCCVNPEHLEPVTNADNIRRGIGFCGVNSRKTHCPHGHPYDAENTYVTVDDNGASRECRKCALARNSRYAARPEARAAKNARKRARSRSLITRMGWYRTSRTRCAARYIQLTGASYREAGLLFGLSPGAVWWAMDHMTSASRR